LKHQQNSPENISYSDSETTSESDSDDDDESNNEDHSYGPFSKIHSLISSEKNRRIVNAANKQEMNEFMQETIQNSQLIVKISLPQLKCLINDQKFLNDIYNCFLNDLIMWEPCKLPPIESLAQINGSRLFSFTDSVYPLLNHNLMTSSTHPSSLPPLFGHLNNENDDKKFFMCKSAILKSPTSKTDTEANSTTDNCSDSDNNNEDDKRHKSDDDKLKRKLRKKNFSGSGNHYGHNSQPKSHLKKIKKKIQNKLCLVLSIDQTHLKSMVIIETNTIQNHIKFGEFDIKAQNFQICIATQENFKSLNSQLDDLSNKTSKKKGGSSGKARAAKYKKTADTNTSIILNEKYRIEKQYIGLFSDQVNIGHATKSCAMGQLKYPTNYTSFENLFQTSKTQELISSNDPNINQTMFNLSNTNGSSSGNNQSDNMGFTFVNSNPPSNNTNTNSSGLVTIPMISIGIKSKFNSKTNTKNILVALNFNNLTLHHIFSTPIDFWIFQLIELFNLIDIDVLGYEAPLVLTGIHLNVTNSCVVYRPVYLQTKCLVTFKSLHWSSNLTPKSSLTLFVFNIEDIYLFLSKVMNQEIVNLKRDYICIANSDLFELRLLINDETRFNRPVVVPRKSPLIDIKLRSNLIQLRTCEDSAFALIELINYIVSDGDLHQPNLNPTFTQNNPSSSIQNNISTQPNLNIQNQTVIEELSSAISTTTQPINIKPINPSTNLTTTFTIGTPPVPICGSASSSSISSMQQQNQNLHNTSSSNNTYFSPSSNSSMSLPPAPSLSFNLKNISSSSSGMSTGGQSSLDEHSNNVTQINTECMISDMVKEAMTTTSTTTSVYKRSGNDLMTQSVYGLSFGDETTSQSELIGSTTSSTNKTVRNMDKFLSDNDDDEESNDHDQSKDDSFHFDMPFSDLSPVIKFNKNTEISFSRSTSLSSNLQNSAHRKLNFSQQQQKQNSQTTRTRKLYFKNNEDDYENNSSNNDDDDDEEDGDLLRDFDIIDVIPGFGEPPKNNVNYEIKVLKKSSRATHSYKQYSNQDELIEVKDDHFKKPLTKIDVLKAPDSFPCPLNSYCVQEISINWFLYGGHDFEPAPTNQPDHQLLADQNVEESVSNTVINNNNNKMSRTVSSPIMVQNQMILNHQRSRANSTSSANNFSLSISPHSYQSPTKITTSPSSNMINVKYSTKTSASGGLKQNNSFDQVSSSLNNNTSKYLQNNSASRKAGGRLINKYDLSSLNWLNRGGKNRNLDLCMEIALHKVKTKIDLYNDQTTLNNQSDENKENQEIKKDASLSAEPPYLYRIALAIGDIEIRDKLVSSPFNMFLFRYESEQCPKHTNSNMIFFKFLCSKSMDSQQLLECDIKLSIQPLRFNIDQDALIFMVDFFTKMGSRDLNDFSKSLIPPPSPTPVAVSSSQTPTQPTTYPSLEHQQQTQQIFIRNFIFSPDLLIKFDFSGKYDKRSEIKMDTITKLLMVVVQLSNTEIKLKRVYYRRGFLGVDKLFQTLIREWLSDIQRNQMKNLIKGWGIFNSLIQFFEGFTYLIWYPIDQYKRDGRVLCGIQKGSAAFSTCTVLATIELTNRMFQATKNVAEFFYDLVTPHRSNQNLMIGFYGFGGGSVAGQMTSSGSNLMDTLLTGAGSGHVRIRRQPNDIREGLTNAYYVMYEGLNDTATNIMQEINQGAEHKGIPGAIGGALRQLPSVALAPIVLATDATCNILSGIKNQLKPDEKKDDDQKWKKITFKN
jgi:hypothetical protein